MQSPINIPAPDPSPTASLPSTFLIDYKFSDKIQVEVRKNMEEVVLEFLGVAGGMKIEYGNGQMLSFLAKRMSFRFPAEHLINGYRLDGSIIIEGEEVTENNNRVSIDKH